MKNIIFFFQLVIANDLQNRRTRVVFVYPDSSYELVLTRTQQLSGKEIEEFIVANVVINHTEHLKEAKH